MPKATLKERTAELKEMTGDFMKDEIAFTKLDFCLLGAILFLAGICIGFLAAPITQGIHIFSHNTNNGNGNGCENGSNTGNQYRNQYHDCED